MSENKEQKQEQPKPAPAPAPAPETNQAQEKAIILAHLDKVEQKWLQDHTGKPGVNPFLSIREHIKPLRLRVSAGEVTPELKAKALALHPDTMLPVNVDFYKPEPPPLIVPVAVGNPNPILQQAKPQ